MVNTTKERILYGALKMFSENGLKGTNLRSLASELDLSKSALYKHYNSKEDIFNTLVDKVESYYQEKINSLSNNKMPETVEEVKAIIKNHISFTMNDVTITRVRKLLTLEQYQNDRISKLATKHFITDIEEFYKTVFSNLIKNGQLREFDINQTVYEFTSSITLLIHWFDREPQLENEIKQRINGYVDYFFTIHKA